MVVEVIDEGALHADFVAAGVDAGAKIVGCVDVEIKLHVAGRAFLCNVGEVFDHLHRQFVERDFEGDALDELVLDVAEEVDLSDADAVGGGRRPHLDGLGTDVERRTFDEVVSPLEPVFAEERKFTRAIEVFHADDTIRVATLGCASTHAGDDAAEGEGGHGGKGSTVFELADAHGADVVENDAVFVERMGGEVDADEVAFLVEPFEVAPTGYVGRDFGMNDGDAHAHVAEEGIGGLMKVGLELVSVAKEGVEEHFVAGCRRKVGFARNVVKSVEGTGENKAFDGFAVAGREVDTFKEIEYGGERPVLLPFVNEAHHG